VSVVGALLRVAARALAVEMGDTKSLLLSGWAKNFSDVMHAFKHSTASHVAGIVLQGVRRYLAECGCCARAGGMLEGMSRVELGQQALAARPPALAARARAGCCLRCSPLLAPPSKFSAQTSRPARARRRPPRRRGWTRCCGRRAP